MMDYSYQSHSAKKILKDALSPWKEAAVLAATPGSGKTTISQIVISNYIKKFPKAKVLVLAHGQTLLKNQYLDSLKEPNVEIDFSFGEFVGKGDFHFIPQVQVGLPQAIHKYPFDKVDLLVVDECHEFYLKPMVQNIIKKLKPKHQVLLTGSPSEFNRLIKEGKKYGITYISGNDLIGNNIFSNVEMEVVRVDYRKNARKALNKMFDHAKKEGKDLSKIMVAVRSINEARNATYYLESIGRKVALSTHKNDRYNIMVKEFKKGNYDTLVVVNRGILGFSDNDITGLFDLRCSKDVDISNQLFARVLRKHPENVKKFYYRCGQKDGDDFNNQVIMLHKIKAMMRNDIFKKYDGTNMEVEVA
jgi:superfamily II DNA or RNA helicase